jgi:predicted lysophospholipase L1 biosynthesis ABC-type transport system permease subunit
VASTLVVAALLRTINETVPENAPALVFYDVQSGQLEDFRAVVAQSPGLERLALAPLVLGRLTHVNATALRDSADAERALEARDEHKLSNRVGNFDDVVITRGAWWPADYRGPPLVAMEDHEADQVGVKVGDRLRFDIMGAQSRRNSPPFTASAASSRDCGWRRSSPTACSILISPVMWAPHIWETVRRRARRTASQPPRPM